MNKQQLAARIWESANTMRSKIEANEYKDYILGLIFYKFLSDKEETFLKQNGYEGETLSAVLHENNESLVLRCQEELGYFIGYRHLFSTWLKEGKSFTATDVKNALEAFNRLIAASQHDLFNGIFNTLELGLNKLGDSVNHQTRALADLIALIRDVPTDGRQDYDVLGFIYEYLISNFAANAGKKAGEFYTPHEVSQLMSEIIADFLKERDQIHIYDPTSGSGSLLITIGKSVSKYMKERDKIVYYAQEWKENTYNLTRMNLIMRGIRPDNIHTRCGDTLATDWPLEPVHEAVGQETPLLMEAVVSNPPYSQHWDAAHCGNDARYSFGVAPRGKADYAFLLHDLYHLKPDGIMTIVLPHGVLFRGNACGGADGRGEGEGRIRRALIHHNHIEAVIGLPENIFFGTTIPTVILVLRRDRTDSDILFIDASTCYQRAGRNNQLTASHIKRIAHTFSEKKTIPGFSRLVTKPEICANGYNLNIARYVRATQSTEQWDLYASMCGGVPVVEIEQLSDYWAVFPQLRKALFQENDTPYAEPIADDVHDVIQSSDEVQAFCGAFRQALDGFDSELYQKLIEQVMTVELAADKDRIMQTIFERLSEIPLIDRYEAYQHLDDAWGVISCDIEILQTEGIEAARRIEPCMVLRKRGDELIEVEEGVMGHVIPLELVEQKLLTEQYNSLSALQTKQAEVTATLQELAGLVKEGIFGECCNEEGSSFLTKELSAALNAIYEAVETPRLAALYGYLALCEAEAEESEKTAYRENHPEGRWKKTDSKLHTPKAVKAAIEAEKRAYPFAPDSPEGQLIYADSLIKQEKKLKQQIRMATEELRHEAIERLTHATEDEVHMLLANKWIYPLTERLYAMPQTVLTALEDAVSALISKYARPYTSLSSEIEQTEHQLADLLDSLKGDLYDVKGLTAFKAMLTGESHAE